MVKKIVIILIILLFGVLSFFIYSAINEGSSAPLAGATKTTAKKTDPVSAKATFGFKEEAASPEKAIEEIVINKKGWEKTAEGPVLKKGPIVKVEHSLEAGPSPEEIKENGKKPKVFMAEAPPMESKRMEEIKPVEKEMAGPAVKKAPLLTGENFGRPGKIARAAEDEKDITETVDKPAIVPVETPPLIMKDETEAAAMKEEIKQPIAKIEAAVEAPRLVEEKKETIPAVGLIIIPQETPVPALTELSSMATKDIMPEREQAQPSVKTEASVAEGSPEKATATNETIPTAEKKEIYMEKPEHFSVEMLKKENNKRVAIFPFENLSDNKDALKHVLPLLIDKLGQKGFEVVDEEDLNSFLCKERIRFSGYVSRELSGKIQKRFNISAVLTGAIISFSGEEIPQFGVMARMIDPSDGSIIWADYSAATGEDFIAILELGRLKTVFSLIPKVIDILFSSFKVEELYKERMPANRIAVMPFKNNTSFSNAGTIATYMFMMELLKSREFIPIEYGDIRDVIIKSGIRRKGDIDYVNIGALAKQLKARGILVGVVDDYSDGIAASAAPNVGITARLIDSSNNNILWYNSSQLSGEDSIIALDWGRIRSVHSVAYSAISSLVKELSKKKWRE
ncbi:MAG: hypothetical protein HZC49_07120 [Nitrospirae bacterium]|nr:hypothetical protein [Nitrospirota bacterium]